MVPISTVRENWWRKLWKLKIHERLKTCLWKLFWSVIPSKGAIVDRLGGKEEAELKCALCGEWNETLTHLLLGCMVSMIIWSLSPWALNISAFLDKPLSSLLTTIIDPFLPDLPIEDHQHLQLFALIAWDLPWCTHNQIVQNAATLDVMHMSSRIYKACGEHVAA